MHNRLISIFVILAFTFSSFSSAMEKPTHDYITSKKQVKYGCPNLLTLAYTYCPSSDTVKKVGVCVLAASIVLMPILGVPLAFAFAEAKQIPTGTTDIDYPVCPAFSNGTTAITATGTSEFPIIKIPGIGELGFKSKEDAKAWAKRMSKQDFSLLDTLPKGKSFLSFKFPNAPSMGKAYNALTEEQILRTQELSSNLLELNNVEKMFRLIDQKPNFLRSAQIFVIENAILIARERRAACEEVRAHMDRPGGQFPWAAMADAVRSRGESQKIQPSLDICSSKAARDLVQSIENTYSDDQAIGSKLVKRIEECQREFELSLKSAEAFEAVGYRMYDFSQRAFLYFSDIHPEGALIILDWFPFTAYGCLLSATLAMSLKLIIVCCKSKTKKKLVIPVRSNRPDDGHGPGAPPPPKATRAPDVETKMSRAEKLAKKTREREENAQREEAAALVERQRRESQRREQERLAKEELENRLIRDYCDDLAAGSGGKKGAFYSAIRNSIEKARKEGFALEPTKELIRNEWARYSDRLQVKRDIQPRKKEAFKQKREPDSKSKTTPSKNEEAKKPLAFAPLKRAEEPRINNNDEIDWTQPLAPKKTKKKRPGPSDCVSLVPPSKPLLAAALNEYLFLAGLLPWYKQLHKVERIHDDIVADNIWYGSLVLYNSLLEHDRVLKVEAKFGDEQSGICQSLFTADDNDFRVIRNIIMHNFPDDRLLMYHCTTTLLKHLGPALKNYCDTGCTAGALATHLAKSELYECPAINIDINQRIENELNKIRNYSGHLNSKETKQREAFHLLDRQNNGKDIFKGHADYKVYDVYTARAIEACLARLGKLYSLYNGQDRIIQTMPPHVVSFMRELNQHFRKLVAHQIDTENTDWHYSPVPAAEVERLMKRAVELSPLARLSMLEGRPEAISTQIIEAPVAELAEAPRKPLKIGTWKFVPSSEKNPPNAQKDE